MEPGASSRDPASQQFDLFVARVRLHDEDRLIFEELGGTRAFYLQRFLAVLDAASCE